MPKITVYCLLLCTGMLIGSPLKSYQNYLQEPAVQRFREYLQIDTSVEENIIHAVEFWKRQAKELDLSICVYTPQEKPVVVMTMKGADPTLPSIMLNSHVDVVPADESEWTHPPFAADMDENGDIFGRGTQDTKDVAIQYLEAIRRLKRDNVTLLRTLHITMMPDEETGGYKGMKAFVDTNEFRSLNVGFALDEGLSSPDNTLYATYEDRRPWQMEFVVHGVGGHGLAMPDGTPMEKTQRLINCIMNYRNVQKRIMKLNNRTDYGSYTSLNINMIHAGVAANIIPSKVSLVVDMRLASDATVSEVENLVKSWLSVTGNTTDLSFIRREDVSGRTHLDDTNPYWMALQQAVNYMGYNIQPLVCPATTDMLVLRNRGIPAVGFTAKAHTVSRIHGKNEYLNVITFLKGIDIYTEIIKTLGNLPPN